MNCAEIRETISAWLDGEASTEEVRKLEEHLATCGKCRSVAKRSQALGTALLRMEAPVPPDFRESLFVRMEKEGLLRRRRSLFAFSIRWAAVPLAAAAAIALFVLNPPNADRNSFSPPSSLPGATVADRTAAESPAGRQEAPALTSEDREIVAHLEILDDPDLFEEERFDEIEIFLPPSRQQG